MQPGKAVSLISSGIDSPVASWMMIQRGLTIIGVTCSSAPLDRSKGKDITVKHCKRVGIRKLYAIDYGPVQQTIARTVRPQFICVICKRFMMRIACAIAEKEAAQTIVTGDNLGQVASQTLDNMVVISQVADRPILRPLLCNDKQETVDVAKRIGTYEIGLDAPPCCEFVPDSPATKSKLDIIQREESKLDIKGILDRAIGTAETIRL